MPKIAAIDVGSNGVRLAVANLGENKKVELLHSLRESLRLGADVFVANRISDASLARAVDIFRRFADQIASLGVTRMRAVATSALREAHNRQDFFDSVKLASGIGIELISGREEAHLIQLAVRRSLDLGDRPALLMDIGGGSAEITILRKGEALSSDTYKMGAVRLLQWMGGDELSDNKKFVRLVEEYVQSFRKRIMKGFERTNISLMVATGGNCESIAEVCADMLDRKPGKAIRAKELDKALELISSMNLRQRMTILRLRPDRADVILPAAIVLRTVMKICGSDELLVPGVGLKNGILFDMADEFGDGKAASHEGEITAAAERLGRKYRVDEDHARQTAAWALRLFDAMLPLHGLNGEARLLLELSALLHEIGQFVSPIGYHKHTQYLLNNNPIMGLDSGQMSIVANVARYSRKSAPKKSHSDFQTLNDAQKNTVMKLFPLLRLAVAMDEERAGLVKDIGAEIGAGKVRLRLKGEGDLLLESWALGRLAPLIREVYGKEFEVLNGNNG